MPGITIKNTQSSIENCLAFFTDIAHNSYKLVGNNKLMAPAGIFINKINNNGERIITLTQNFKCHDAGLYIFESTYKLPSQKVMVNSLCLNVTRPAPHKVSQNFLQNKLIAPPNDYNTVTINVQSQPKVEADVEVYLVQSKEVQLNLDSSKNVSSTTLSLQEQGNQDPNPLFVTLTPPVFVDWKDSQYFLKQQKATDQLPDVYPADTIISVSLAGGAPLPSNIMNYDPTSRKMTYYFDQPTAGIVSTFVLEFSLTTSTGNTQTYYQTITFTEISSGVWFETPPPNITAPIGKQTTYPFPKLIIKGASLQNYSLYYPKERISATWVPLGSSSSLILGPIAGQIGIHSFQFEIQNTGGYPNLYYNFTVTVPNTQPVFDPLLINQRVMLGNSKPHFDPVLINQRIMLCNSISYYELPKIVDNDSDPVSIVESYNNGSSFIFFDASNYSAYQTGTISIDTSTLTKSEIGNYTVVFDLDDGIEIAQYSLNIEVYPNTPPQFNTTVIPFITDFTLTLGSELIEKKIPPPYDVDNQSLVITVNPVGSPFIHTVDDIHLFIIFSPPSSPADYGIFEFQVDVSDSINITSFTFKVTAKNSLATVSLLQNLTKVYDVDSAPITESIDMNTYFLKSHFNIGEVLDFFSKVNLPGWLTIGNDNLIVDITDSLQPLGTTSVDIYVKDSSGESSLTSVTATIILDKAPYYPDLSQLNQVLTCCNVESLTLPTPMDNLDTTSQIKVEFPTSPPWLTVSNSAKLSVDTSQLATPATNSFTVLLTDTLLLSRSYTVNINLNHRPEWTIGQPPVSSVTVLSGGVIKCVEYGSMHSSDPDSSDSYKVTIQLLSAGLPLGLNVNVVNLTNITVQALSGYNIAGNYTIGIFLKDMHGAQSLTSQNLTITVVADTSKPLLSGFQYNMGPPFFVGVHQISDVTMERGTTVKKILPEIDDPDSQDSWKISIENFASSGLYQFTYFSYPSLIFSPWDSSHAGLYNVTLVLKDHRCKASRYSFNLIITDPLFTNNDSRMGENDRGAQDDAIETIQDLDSNLFQSGDSAKVAQKNKVYLPRRVIAERAKLSQELMARISSINSIGDLTVQFNRDVRIPAYYNSFNQTIIEITLINKTKSKLRVLDAIEQVQVTHEEKKLDFKWGIKSFSPRKITFKLDFDDPLEVSKEVTHIFL